MDASNLNPIALSFITSNKGNTLLVLNEHLYKCNKKTASKKYWMCIISSCKVYVHTTLDDSYWSGGTEPHDHSLNPELIEVKPVRMIYDEEMAKVSMSTSAIAMFPTNHEICR